MKSILVNKGKITLIALLCICGINGCDLLNQKPKNITYQKVFWEDQQEAQQALAGAYGLFKSALMTQSAFLYWGSFPSKTVMSAASWIVDGLQSSGGYHLPYRKSTRSWKRLFKAANWAYTVEYYVKRMDNSKFGSKKIKKQIIGQAAFIRALSYFWMTRVWGDVPIVKSDKPLESTNQLITDSGYVKSIPRSSELEVLNYILNTVNKSIRLLEYSSPADPNWAITANKASAQALKAYVLLWYASRDENSRNVKKIKKSIAAADSIIKYSNASLINYVTGGKKAFNRMFRGQSKTGLFEINISTANNESYRIADSGTTPMGLTADDPFFQNEGSSPGIEPDYYTNRWIDSDSSEKNDVRLKLFFYKYHNAKEGYLLKYTQTSDDPTVQGDPYARFSETNILLFRLAGIYLLRAEAYTYLGNVGMALKNLNIIRRMAGVPNYTGPTDKSSLIQAIFNQRSIEFVGEGQAAFDRIRMKFWKGVSWMTSNRIAKEGYFWPVSDDIIRKSPKIKQTLYWRTH